MLDWLKVVLVLGLGLSMLLDGWKRMRTPAQRSMWLAPPQATVALGLGFVCFGLRHLAVALQIPIFDALFAGIGAIAIVAMLLLALRERSRDRQFPWWRSTK